MTSSSRTLHSNSNVNSTINMNRKSNEKTNRKTKRTQRTKRTRKPKREAITYKESFKQWCSSLTLEEAQDNVLSRLPFYPESDGTRIATVHQINVGNGKTINEFTIKNIEPSSTNLHIVILHGFGAALGLYYRNFDTLSKIPGVTIHALDLAGHGNSSRHDFIAPGKNHYEIVSNTENWFLDPLEEWRKTYKDELNKFILIGHSMGGYLSMIYTLKHPERVSKLILISPVGVERNGYSKEVEDQIVSNKNVDLNKFDLNKKDAPDFEQELIVSQSAITGDDLKEEGEEKEYVKIPHMPKIAIYLWSKHWSPFAVMKAFGPIGPRIISFWSHQRFNGVDKNEFLTLHSYCYKCMSAKSSGEYGLTRLLAPGALAYFPLSDRIQLFRNQLKCKTLWIYGDKDWMNKDAGAEVVEWINKKMGDDQKARFEVVEEAGHHVYLDNPDAFNKLVLDFIN